MKKILSFLLAIIGLCGYSQDEYYRKVDWKFYPENVIQLTDSTYLTDAYPFDYNDVGAIQRVVGNYVVDFVGHRYEVIDSTTTTITVLDIYHIGQAPQTGQIARCYRSVGDGEAEYIGSIDYSPLDESSRWKLNGSDNELLWRQTIGKAENGLYKDLRTVKLGGDLIEPTTINQDDNSFKILNNRHGSVFSEAGIAYTKIDTAQFLDSTLVTKMYVKSLIKEGTNHDSLTIASGSTGYFEVNYPQIFSGQKLIDSLGVINNKITGKEPALTKGNLTAGSSKVTIGGTGTNAVIGSGASIDINEANIVHQNISGHGTNTHTQIDTHITNDGDLSSTNEIQDLSLSGNTLSLSGDASTVDLSVYAPASGSANYIWNQNAVQQSGTFNISGDGFLGNRFRLGGSYSGLNFAFEMHSANNAFGWSTALLSENYTVDSSYGGLLLGFRQNTAVIGEYITRNISIVPDGGNLGVGYVIGTEIDNHKLAINGNAFFNGFINTTGYKLSGVDLFSSLTTNTLEKWDGTKHTSIANASGYLYNDGTGAMSFTSIPAAVTSISAGNGMNFTTITGTGSVVLGTPSTLTASTTNAVTTTSHTHQITGFLPLTGGTLTGAVTSNNSFTGTNFILSSDKRLKQGIRTLTNTDWVERIKFVRYEMKSNPEIERYGVIAQDVEEVNKYLVYTDENGVKSVSYIDLLIAKIANLEKRISELETKKKRHEK